MAQEREGKAELTFEKALENLERVVVRLEKGELSLEESLTAYEDGVRLVQQARDRLDGMQSRLEQLLHDGKTAPLTSEKAPEKAGERPGETSAAKPETSA